MRLSDCKTWEQMESFMSVVSPCHIEGNRLFFLDKELLKIRKEKDRFVAYQGEHRFKDILDENELRDSSWLAFRMSFCGLRIHYWHILLLPGMNCWAFRDSNPDGPDFFNTFLPEEYDIRVKKDSDESGVFYVDAKIKRMKEIPFVKKKMLEMARGRLQSHYENCGQLLKALDDTRLLKQME